MKTISRRPLLFGILLSLVAAVSVPVLFYGGVAAVRIVGEYLLRTDFDPVVWREGAWDPSSYPVDNRRIRMIDDLLDRHDLRQMTRAQVTALLGDSDYPDPDESRRHFPGWDLVYYLGPERGLIAMDSEWLAIRLDEQQQVAEHRIVVP